MIWSSSKTGLSVSSLPAWGVLYCSSTGYYNSIRNNILAPGVSPNARILPVLYNIYKAKTG